jgi:hypothetical protein
MSNRGKPARRNWGGPPGPPMCRRGKPTGLRSRRRPGCRRIEALVKSVKRRRKFFRLFLVFFLYSSLSFSSPFYVECENIFPDEWLDLFGIPFASHVSTLKTKSSTYRAILAFSDSIAYERNSEYNRLGEFCWLLLTSDLVLSVALRC